MYRGFYLNLSRNHQRRESLTRHLEEIGAASRYERFEAVDGRAVAADHPTPLDPGNLGLWLTHERLIESIGRSADGHLHIVEDDAVLAANAVHVLDRLLAEMDKNFPGWDLLLTDMFLQPRPDVFVPFLEKMKLFAKTREYTIIELARIPFACTTSLVLNKASLGKYAELMRGQWKLGKPIDIHIRELVRQKSLKAYFTVPFVTSISPESDASDIRGRLSRSRRICDTFRRALFQDANVPALLKEIQQLTADIKVSPLVGIYLSAEMFVLSDQFEKY